MNLRDMYAETGHWIVDGNVVRVCVTDLVVITSAHTPIDETALYGLLRRGEWIVYVSSTDPVCLMLAEMEYISFYKISRTALERFFDYYYCGMKYQRELDWRKCGF